MKNPNKQLLEYYRQLPESVAQQLLDYAEFLVARHTVIPVTLCLPENIERPKKESVVIAVKRLTTTFPMINKDKLLDVTASLVSQNMLQGRDAVEVINELEALFKKHYDEYVKDFSKSEVRIDN